MTCLQVTKAAFQQLLGKEPKVAAIHAGLECGIIGVKVPGMDGAHSPDEQVTFSIILICSCCLKMRVRQITH